MTSFAFFFNAATFEKHRLQIRAGLTPRIEYVAFDDKQPFNSFRAGDELFIVGLRASRVHLAGRMVVRGAPVSEVAARTALGRSDLISKPLYCLADMSQLDVFRAHLSVPKEIAAGLELYRINGDATNTASLKDGRPDPNLFRACPRLSPASADQLRNLLGR